MTGFNTIALVTVSVAAVGSVAAYALVRGATSCAQAARRQLRRSRSPALPEPARVYELPTEYASIIVDSITGNRS